ncbi:hypothetical protein JK365_12775 [Salmonella enterica subsp. enterica serovar Ceyco]|uniref:hypothetical protein n=1 Tax=Salmonella enterica TaxID=28901 RepID=UPI0019223DC7|nr:hypothetical protein [Salmonella enterica subsp. enterica serovar Lexington]MBL1253346.1 hypothetical protein [Salmonella enterica subsp. enterica serovar Ceyco]
MKIKRDFISNSSSTSFIYISQNEFSKDMFFKAIGISSSSPLCPMFEDFYRVLEDAINGGERVFDIKKLNVDERYPEFSNSTLEHADDALKNNKKVILCSLSSETELPETFLCIESFEILSPDFIINAYNNYW